MATAMQQFRKYATVLEQLLGSGPRSTMEVLLEAMYSMGPLRGHITRQTEMSLGNAVKWSELVGEWVS
jgi:hypothetical protein